MTSRVVVHAHCGDDTEVKILHSSGGKTEEVSIQNGETFEAFVYDNSTCFVSEIKKKDDSHV